jgi:hypothetical protein
LKGERKTRLIDVLLEHERLVLSFTNLIRIWRFCLLSCYSAFSILVLIYFVHSSFKLINLEEYELYVHLHSHYHKQLNTYNGNTHTYEQFAHHILTLSVYIHTQSPSYTFAFSILHLLNICCADLLNSLPRLLTICCYAVCFEARAAIVPFWAPYATPPP